VTAEIDLFVRTWEDLMQQRKRFAQRGQNYVTGEVRAQGLLDISEMVAEAEQRTKAALEKLIHKHPLYEWLKEAKTAGPRAATILAMIRHPHRFPGQKCSEGHYLLPTFEIGVPCPCAAWVEEQGSEQQPCTGVVEAPRLGTGARAVWKMAGQYPITTEKGVRLARKMKGVQSSHNGRAKTAILMPQGIGQQFFMQHSRYETVYYAAKERLLAAHPEDNKPGKLGRWETTARVIAAKAWLGDLLMEWKRIVPLGEYSVVGPLCGQPDAELVEV